MVVIKSCPQLYIMIFIFKILKNRNSVTLKLLKLFVVIFLICLYAKFHKNIPTRNVSCWMMVVWPLCHHFCFTMCSLYLLFATFRFFNVCLCDRKALTVHSVWNNQAHSISTSYFNKLHVEIRTEFATSVEYFFSDDFIKYVNK